MVVLLSTYFETYHPATLSIYGEGRARFASLGVRTEGSFASTYFETYHPITLSIYGEGRANAVRLGVRMEGEKGVG